MSHACHDLVRFLPLILLLVCFFPEHGFASISVVVTADECPSPTSVFFDERQNIILAACSNQIISIQLPQRTLSILVSDSLCWAPEQLFGDSRRNLAFAACVNSGLEPPNVASSVMLAGPGYRDVSVFTNFGNCSWVGGFAWDINSPLSFPMMYMTCMSSPALIAKSSGANQTVIPLVNNTVECYNSAVALLDGFLYTGCGNNEYRASDSTAGRHKSSPSRYLPYDTTLYLVSLNLRSLELNILSLGDGFPGWVALSIAATKLNDGKVQLLYGCTDLMRALIQNGQVINNTVLTNNTQCEQPVSVALRESPDGSQDAFVACGSYDSSILDVPVVPSANISAVTTDQECPAPIWNVWHSPSGCLFAACLDGAILSICNLDTSKAASLDNAVDASTLSEFPIVAILNVD